MDSLMVSNPPTKYTDIIQRPNVTYISTTHRPHQHWPGATHRDYSGWSHHDVTEFSVMFPMRVWLEPFCWQPLGLDLNASLVSISQIAKYSSALIRVLNGSVHSLIHQSQGNSNDTAMVTICWAAGQKGGLDGPDWVASHCQPQGNGIKQRLGQKNIGKNA